MERRELLREGGPMTNPKQINQGGAQNKEKQPPGQTGSKATQEQSQMEGPAAYAPHDEGAKKGSEQR